MRDPDKIKRSVYSWGVCFAGTREALVAASICNPGPFPCDPEDRRTRDARGVRHGPFMTTDPRGREIKIGVFPGRRFCVTRNGLTEHEAAEWKRLDQAEQARREECAARLREEGDRRLAAELRKMYPTSQDFRIGLATDFAAVFRGIVQTPEETGKYGWRLCAEDRERIAELKAALVAAIQSARVVRDGEPERARLRLVK